MPAMSNAFYPLIPSLPPTLTLPRKGRGDNCSFRIGFGDGSHLQFKKLDSNSKTLNPLSPCGGGLGWGGTP